MVSEPCLYLYTLCWHPAPELSIQRELINLEKYFYFLESQTATKRWDGGLGEREGRD